MQLCLKKIGSVTEVTGTIFTNPSQLCDHANKFFVPMRPIVHWLPNKRFAWPQGFVNMAPGYQFFAVKLKNGESLEKTCRISSVFV
jgi:hypothetical protein